MLDDIFFRGFLVVDERLEFWDEEFLLYEKFDGKEFDMGWCDFVEK